MPQNLPPQVIENLLSVLTDEPRKPERIAVIYNKKFKPPLSPSKYGYKNMFQLLSRIRQIDRVELDGETNFCVRHKANKVKPPISSQNPTVSSKQKFAAPPINSFRSGSSPLSFTTASGRVKNLNQLRQPKINYAPTPKPHRQKIRVLAQNKPDTTKAAEDSPYISTYSSSVKQIPGQAYSKHLFDVPDRPAPARRPTTQQKREKTPIREDKPKPEQQSLPIVTLNASQSMRNSEPKQRLYDPKGMQPPDLRQMPRPLSKDENNNSKAPMSASMMKKSLKKTKESFAAKCEVKKKFYKGDLNHEKWLIRNAAKFIQTEVMREKAEMASRIEAMEAVVRQLDLSIMALEKQPLGRCRAFTCFNLVSIMSLPCGHLYCQKCATRMERSCFMCQSEVTGLQKLCLS